ncbi:DNA polymerase Y family protein [Actinacidiphila acidipaludis]|uniref:ImpB/MucB/SamB family protein n=1 Tax=Actinacidiphila acidipaludis TaxID=2873382 RepID=A0ABS7QI93_9ACTN|nr:ImpB/MucB/SamB family protein [Streptomyces acidipaludis]MBY8882896.1 ImpB/MucB/SamB family protein [Streptomyces acidipaludis]
MSTTDRYIAHLHLHGRLTEDRYEEVLDLLAGITPKVAAIPPNAVQLDLTGALRYFDREPYEVLQLARLRIAALYGIDTSAGLGPNRMIAAMAAATAPPGRTVHVSSRPDAAAQWLRLRPVAALPGVGKATATTLARYGLHTIGQIADLPPATLQRILGAGPARALADRACGIDINPVTPHAHAERLTADHILERDCLDPRQHHAAVLALAEQIGIRLRDDHRITSALTLTVRYADRSHSTRSRRLPEPTAHSPALAATALGMLNSLGLQRARVRAYALRAEQLDDEDTAYHQMLLDPADERARAAEAAADRARRRFGHDAVKPGTLANHPAHATTPDRP